MRCCARRSLRRGLGQILILALLVLFSSALSAEAAPDSAAPTAEPSAADELRVVLGNASGAFESTSATVSADGPYRVTQGPGGTSLFQGAAGQRLTVTRNTDGLWLTPQGQATQGPYPAAATLELAASSGSVRSYLAEADGLRYRGKLWLRVGPSAGKVAVINVVTLEAYLYGTVPNEIIPSWGLETAKVQAIAARTYALGNLTRFSSYGANLCDTTACQVYRGLDSELAVTTRAVDETRGQVLRYNGALAAVFYYSDSGGHTEAADAVFGGAPVPYLKGMDDGPDALPSWLDLTTESGARTFFTSPTYAHYGYSSDSPAYRWTLSWGRAQLEAILDTWLPKLNDRQISPAFPAGGHVGTLQALNVQKRGVSGRILALEIVGSEGTWLLKGESAVRTALRRPSSVQPDDPTLATMGRSAGLVLDPQSGPAGGLATIVAHGGGYGHGVGLSQWGAHGMAAAGLDYAQILQRYFPGTSPLPALNVNLKAGGRLPLVLVGDIA